MNKHVRCLGVFGLILGITVAVIAIASALGIALIWLFGREFALALVILALLICIAGVAHGECKRL
jgi:hypothetical protein